MNSETSFGEWVRRRRKALDLTQEQLAQRVGCSHSAIRKIELEERRPSVQVAELLATHLEIPDDQRALFLHVARRITPAEELPVSSIGLVYPPPTQEEPAETSQTFIPAPNLPVHPTPFIGRKQDLATLSNMLQDPHCRLITLVGQGGVGKTRLSLEAAAHSLAMFSNRVYFIQLAPITEPDSILPTIASVFGLVSPNSDLKARLLSYLRDKNALLVLDNFEHLIEGANLLNDLLGQAPRLKLLVTSRERLNLQGEWTLELTGMSVPPNAEQAALGVYDALALFEQSAKRIRPTIAFTEQDRLAIVHICRRVDGLPLAIELSAAWINLLSPDEIAAEIEKTFDFLKSSLRDVPERHRSLRAAFEHSWNLLNETERRVLSNLSVFHGGFTREAAQAIAKASLAVLSDLWAKSLIHRTEDGRFEMHDVIRQYAHAYLLDEDQIRASHGRYFLSMLQEADIALKGAEQFKAIHKLTAEFGNLQSAWAWGVQQHAFEALHKALPAVWLAYDVRGWLQTGFENTQALVQTIRRSGNTDESQVILAHALAFHGMFCFRLGNYAQAKSVLDESLSILRPLNRPQALIPPLIFNGIVTSLKGDVISARTYLEEGIELAERFKNEWFLALGQFNVGFQAGMLGQHEEAYRLMRVGLTLWRTMGNARFTAMALNFLSASTIELNRRVEARQLLDESLQLTSSMKDRWGMGTALGRLGALSLSEGDLLRAETQLQQSIALFTELGARHDLAWSLLQLGRLYVQSEELRLAEQTLRQALAVSLDVHAMPQLIEESLELADCFMRLGEDEKALTLLLYLQQQSSPNSAILQPRIRVLINNLESKSSTIDRQAVDETLRAQTFEEFLSSRIL